MPRWLLILGGILAALALVALLVLGWAWWAVKSVPEEYVRVLVVPAETKKKSSDDLERNVSALVSDAKRANDWQAVFTQDQLNAWLAEVLPQKFPDQLPAEVKEPRVVLSPGRVQLFARYAGGQIETVVSLDVEIALTNEPNQLALKIRAARAGSLPLPLDDLKAHADKATIEAGLPLQWRQDGGTPVAILTIPPDDPHFKREVFIEKLELREGAIILKGRTGKALR